MVGDPWFDYSLIAIFVTALVTFVSLLFVDAPYGRHLSDGWGPSIPVRLGWVIMESPACLVFLYFFLSGPNSGAIPAIALCLMWQLHYVHRSFIYPFKLNVREGARTSLFVIIPGLLFCAINGYLNGAYIAHYSEHLNNDWLTDWRFIVGVSLFAIGYYVNKQSDTILKNLRSDGSKGYKIPYGGMFKWVSMPNYFGELLTWTGFALASWSLAGLSFVCFTAANLIPRALSNHRWYKETFAEYPVDRKAVIPKLL